MTEQDIFYEYEKILLGKRKNYSSEIFANQTAAGKEEIALMFFRCIFEKYLKWTPQEAYYCLNEEVIRTMKLVPLIRFIRFPSEFNPMQDCFYIVAKAYPDEFTINSVKQTEIVYNRVLSGEASRYPKFFFEGQDGIVRALICLKYAIKEYLTVTTANELYRYFAHDGVVFLKKYKLWDAFVLNFGTIPIDYLHSCFTKEVQQEYSFLYNKYKMIDNYKKETIKKKEKEECS